MSGFYHLLFPERFEKSLQQHGQIFAALIRTSLGPNAQKVLDVSCGIGTQALGLARLGYQVTASDISPAAVARARREAAARGLTIAFSVADMREARRCHRDRYDVVLSADSAIQHVLSEDEILRTFEGFYQLTTEGGGCIVTARDFEMENPREGYARLYRIRE